MRFLKFCEIKWKDISFLFCRKAHYCGMFETMCSAEISGNVREVWKIIFFRKELSNGTLDQISHQGPLFGNENAKSNQRAFLLLLHAVLKPNAVFRKKTKTKIKRSKSTIRDSTTLMATRTRKITWRLDKRNWITLTRIFIQ